MGSAEDPLEQPLVKTAMPNSSSQNLRMKIPRILVVLVSVLERHSLALDCKDSGLVPQISKNIQNYPK